MDRSELCEEEKERLRTLKEVLELLQDADKSPSLLDKMALWIADITAHLAESAGGSVGALVAEIATLSLSTVLNVGTAPESNGFTETLGIKRKRVREAFHAAETSETQPVLMDELRLTARHTRTYRRRRR